MHQFCPGCGARLPDSAEQCDLCGTAVSDADMDAVHEYVGDSGSDDDSSESVQEQVERTPIGLENGAEPAVYCNQCGNPNPGDSKFCNRCGSPIRIIAGGGRRPSGGSGRGSVSPPDLSTASASAGPGRSDPGVGRQVGVIVGAGVLIVMTWYIFSIVVQDRQQEPGLSSTSALFGNSDAPLPPQFQKKEGILQSSIDSLSGVGKIARQRELVDLYVSANRPDLAGGTAESIAEELNTEATWIAAGNLYYDWMETVDPSQKVIFAKKTIAAYRSVLDINPKNLDARTDMAIAYMYDPDNPMLAIQETMKVLEYDSLHVNANFNRAIMLLQINRVDAALSQLEKVKRIVGDPNNPVYKRAEEVIAETKKGSRS